MRAVLLGSSAVLLAACGDDFTGVHTVQARETYSVRGPDLSDVSSTQQRALQISIEKTAGDQLVMRFGSCALQMGSGGAGVLTVIGPSDTAGGCTVDVPNVGPSTALLGGNLQRTDRGLSGSLQGSVTHAASGVSGTYSAVLGPAPQ